MSTHWTTYDDPALLSAVSRDVGAHRREALLRLDGMHCSACVRRVERALQRFTREVRVNLSGGTVEFQWDGQQHRLSELLSALDDVGFRPTLLEDSEALRREREARRTALKRIGVAVILGMQVMMIASGQYFGAVDPSLIAPLRWSELLFATPVAFYAGWPFLAGAWRAVSARTMTMDVPVATAIMLAYFASAWHTVAGRGDVYFDSVAMFVMLLLTARYFQDAGRAKAAERLRRLASAQPLTATRLNAGSSAEVPVSALAIGDVLLVAPGEAAPVDGKLLSGSAEFDEALLTGESVPVAKRAADTLLAGSVNVGHTPVELRVERIGQGTALSQVTRLLHRAQSVRPQAQVIADRIAGYFLSAMLLLSFIALVFWWPEGPDRAIGVVLAILVATCPCALSMAMPVALAAAGSRLARDGLLVARADALLRLKQVDTVCFDKTGTLTTGALRLARCITLDNTPDSECTALAAALELGSSHPIARAFAAHAGRYTADRVTHIAGSGINGDIDGYAYALGIPEQLAPDADLPARTPGLSWILLTRDGSPLALFGLAPTLRPEAAQSVAGLRARGLQVELLSGDGREAVESLAKQLDVAVWHARQQPEDKLARVRALQENSQRGRHGVLAIGDGINDAPLLAAAQVSAAMAAGSAMSQARADILLVRNQLDALPQLFDVAARTRRIVVQNLFWAASYNTVMVPLAFAGYLTPWMGALGMGASSLLVVLNALRLARRPAQPTDDDESAAAQVGAPA